MLQWMNLSLHSNIEKDLHLHKLIFRFYIVFIIYTKISEQRYFKNSDGRDHFKPLVQPDWGPAHDLIAVWSFSI